MIDTRLLNLDRVREVFFPFATKKIAELKQKQSRLVHYTSAEAAVSILRNRNVWMRNATTMNDFMEVEHGFECLNKAYKGEAGTIFKMVLDKHFPGSAKELEARFNAWLPGFRTDTYMTCVSEHLDSEDIYGRLSMWRAYGGNTGVALVLNSKPFYSETNVLKAYSSPVAYLDSDGFSQHFLCVAKAMETEQLLIAGLGKEAVFAYAFQMLRFAVLCTKHPGFQEELEWRVLYSPTMEKSKVIQEDVVVVSGTPQKIYKIPIQDYAAEGLKGMTVAELIDRIIIGPTQFPNAMYQAFCALLVENGVGNPESRVVVSDIPLRL